jgi:hypothetical protein
MNFKITHAFNLRDGNMKPLPNYILCIEVIQQTIIENEEEILKDWIFRWI